MFLRKIDHQWLKDERTDNILFQLDKQVGNNSYIVKDFFKFKISHLFCSYNYESLMQL